LTIKIKIWKSRTITRRAVLKWGLPETLMSLCSDIPLKSNSVYQQGQSLISCGSTVSNMTAGDLRLCRLKAKIRFITPAKLPLWSGNSLRSGLGARLRDVACINRGQQDDCDSCPHQSLCIYDSIYNARVLPGKQNLRRTADPPRPFALMPPIPGDYSAGLRKYARGQVITS